MRCVAPGEMRCSPVVGAILLRRVASLAAERRRTPPENGSPRPAYLTPRELETIALVDAGRSNKQIAQRLQIELPTVKNHVHRVLEKLLVTRRGDAVAAFRARPHRTGDPPLRARTVRRCPLGTTRRKGAQRGPSASPTLFTATATATALGRVGTAARLSPFLEIRNWLSSALALHPRRRG